MYVHILYVYNIHVHEGMCCDCTNSKYCYGPVGHVVTGDLTIIRDAKLRSLIKKGPSFREQNCIDWTVNERLCREAVAKYKRRWSTREGVDVRIFNEWDHKVNECITRKIASLRSKHINKRKKHILKTRKHLESLKTLHDRYVLVPADKAANNVIVVCRKYYLEIVIREITTTTTYEHVSESVTDIVTRHLQFMNKYKVKIKPELLCLPSFYWLPKLHKQPYNSRFIAASYRCTTKPLSKLLTGCLSMVLKHFRQYCNGIYCRTGVNCFWVLPKYGSETL